LKTDAGHLHKPQAEKVLVQWLYTRPQAGITWANQPGTNRIVLQNFPPERGLYILS
jgi:hypothetical protein